jgi:hypothetical protein
VVIALEVSRACGLRRKRFGYTVFLLRYRSISRVLLLSLLCAVGALTFASACTRRGGPTKISFKPVSAGAAGGTLVLRFFLGVPNKE